MANVCVSCPSSAPPRRSSYRRSAPRARPRRRAPVRRRAPARRPIRRMTRRQKRGLTKFELAQVNPFDRRVDGVKIPDSNTQPSDTARSEDRVVFTGSATDKAQCKMFFPTLSNTYVDSVDSTAAAWTWAAIYGGASSSAQQSAFIAAYQGVRICAHGIRISCQAAPTSVTGFVHVAVYPVCDFNSTTWAMPVNLSQMSMLPWYRRFTLAQLTQRSVTVVNKFLDSTATRYFDTASDQIENSTNSGFQFGSSWCAILVAVEGAPILTSNLSVENLVHYECLPKFGASQTVSPAANFNVSELQDVSRIAGNGNSIFQEGEEDHQINQALNALGQGALSAVQDIYDDYVLPGVRRAGYAAAGYAARRAFGGIPGVNQPRLMEY